jgi:hypothetical protein
LDAKNLCIASGYFCWRLLNRLKTQGPQEQVAFMKHKNVNKAGKDQGTGGKACWDGYRRVGANGCAKMKKRKK